MKRRIRVLVIAAAVCLLAGCGSTAKSEPLPPVPTPTPQATPALDARTAAVLLTSSDLGPGWIASRPRSAPLPESAEGAVAGGVDLRRNDHLVAERVFVFPTESAAHTFFTDWTSVERLPAGDGTRELRLRRIGDQSAAFSHPAYQAATGPLIGASLDMTVLEGDVVFMLLGNVGFNDELIEVASAAARAAHRSPPTP